MQWKHHKCLGKWCEVSWFDWTWCGYSIERTAWCWEHFHFKSEKWEASQKKNEWEAGMQLPVFMLSRKEQEPVVLWVTAWVGFFWKRNKKSRSKIPVIFFLATWQISDNHSYLFLERCSIFFLFVEITFLMANPANLFFEFSPNRKILYLI